MISNQVRKGEQLADKISRRTILLRGIQIPLGSAAMFALASCGGGGNESTALVCADPENLTSSERNMRQSLNYTETSPVPDEVCAGCAFFHAGTATDACGTCDIFNGQPVNPEGRCDSWSAKA